MYKYKIAYCERSIYCKKLSKNKNIINLYQNLPMTFISFYCYLSCSVGFTSRVMKNFIFCALISINFTANKQINNSQ